MCNAIAALSSSLNSLVQSFATPRLASPLLAHCTERMNEAEMILLRRAVDALCATQLSASLLDCETSPSWALNC